MTSVTVVVNALPVVTISGEKEICNGLSTVLTASGGNVYIWNNGVTSNSITVSPIAMTTYSVTVTDNKGCSSATNVTVLVNSLPVVAINGDKEICAGESTTLTTGGGMLFAWSNGSSTNSITISPAVTTTYGVTVTDAKGCSSNTSVTVQVNALPEVTISGDKDICAGESTTLTTSGGSGYIWSNGATTSQIIVSPSVTTTYSVTVTDEKGCSSSESVTVQMNALPDVAISGNNELCSGESTTLSASIGSTYVWSTGATTRQINVNPAITTTYGVTVTNNSGCSNPASFTVKVNPLPELTISGDNDICLGESTTLIASGGAEYIWSTGSTINNITINPETTTIYGVTVSDGKGCKSSSNITVVVNPLPAVIINGDNEICLGENTTLTAVGGTLFSWSNGMTTSSIIVNPLVTTIYSVTVINVQGCQNVKNVEVIVNALPQALISGVNNICIGESTILSASGGTTYLWSNGSTSSTITVSPISASTYSVTVSNAQGCTASTSILVTINQPPAIEIVGPNNICKGDSTVLVASGNSSVECPGECKVVEPLVLSYWNLDACHSVMNLGTHMDYSEFSPIVNNGTCTNVTAGNVHRLNNNKHSCTPGSDGSIGMCIGSQKTCNPSKIDFSQALRFQITLNPAQSGQITGLQFYEQSPENYQWIGGQTGLNNYATKYLIRVSKNGEYIYYEDNINTNRTWGLESFDFTENDNFRTLTQSTYLFELIPYCTINNDAVESVWDIDEIKILGGCCQGSTQNISTYLWSNGDTGTSITVNPTETTTYTVTVTDCSGCSSIKVYDVTVACLIADLGPDRMINLGETVVLSPDISGKSICSDQNPAANTIKYLWSNGATTSSITVTPTSSTFYRVTVTDCNECEDTESISIHVMMARPFIIYPNPASDRINLASESEIDPNMSVRILSVDGKTLISQKPQLVINSINNVSVIIPENITDGIYFLEIKNGTRVFTEKLILIKK
jgi:predicted transcriptional regulator